MKRYTRRHVITLFVSTAAAGLLASCAGGQATLTPAPATPQATPAPSPTTAAAASPAAPVATPTVVVTPTRSGPVTLKILRWSHFVPDYDKWFDSWVQEWGAKNNVQVVSDHINYADTPARAAAEVSAKSGHDLFAFGFPPSQYETEVVPLNDLIDELKKEYGDYYPLLERSCHNPKTDVWYSFMDFWAADPILYSEGPLRPSWQDLRYLAGYPGSWPSAEADGQPNRHRFLTRDRYRHGNAHYHVGFWHINPGQGWKRRYL